MQHGSFAALHALYWVTVNLASEGPVVICVDDVQWCDGASLRYLAYLVKRLEGLRCWSSWHDVRASSSPTTH